MSDHDCDETEIFVGNFTTFRFHVVDELGRDVDLQGLSGAALTVIFNRPIGAPLVVFGSVSTADPDLVPVLADGEDGRYEYAVTASTFLDEAGDWKRQGFVTLPGGLEYRTKILTFEVKTPLPIV